MITLTDEEYEAFKKWRSVESIENLEQDIDAPIKKCVMALALLGCEPIWSCCGFDYAGQPIHKSHEYGCVGIATRDNRFTREVTYLLEESLPPFSHYANGWKIKYYSHYGNNLCSFTSDITTLNTWPDRSSVHHSEPGTIAIQLLESFLFGLSDRFLDSVILKDTNGEFKRRFSSWQYPAKKDWLIRKCDL